MDAANRELDALIVSNISDLEASIKRAEDSIDLLLNAEAWDELKRTLGTDSWYFEGGEEPASAWFVPRDWLIEDEEGDVDADPWFRFKPLDGRGEFHTWLAHYVAPKSDRQKMAIVWCWHQFYVSDYSIAATMVREELQAIVDLGFRQDGRELFYPISFDADVMAKGFLEGDLKAALAPIAQAAGVLVQAIKPFSAFRAALLKVAR